MSLHVNESEDTVTNGTLENSDNTQYPSQPRTNYRDAILPSGTHFACAGCDTPRVWDTTVFCGDCGDVTGTVIKWNSTNKLYEKTAWECGGCHSVVYRLWGGSDTSNGYFRQRCDECMKIQDFIWSDNRDGYCCAICRYEKAEPEEDEDEEKYWKGYCASCACETNTEKVDVLKTDIICCAASIRTAMKEANGSATIAGRNKPCRMSTSDDPFPPTLLVSNKDGVTRHDANAAHTCRAQGGVSVSGRRCCEELRGRMWLIAHASGRHVMT